MNSQEVTRTEAKPTEVHYRTPDVEVYEDEQALWVSADLPGVAPSGLEVALDNGVLSITGQIEDSKPDAPVSYAFRRRFTINDPNRFDADHVDAVLKNGVLDLKLPKAERAKRRQIPVTVN